MTKVPERLKNFNFVLCNKEKAPIEKAWTSKIHRANDSILLTHLKRRNNYGVRGGQTSPISISGKTYFLVIVDFDSKELQDKIMPLLPETFTTTSGSPKECCHLWFASDGDKSFSVLSETADTLCDVIAEGKQVIAPGSKHKSGSTYSIIKDIPFAFVPYAELEAILKPCDKSPKKPQKERKINLPKGTTNDLWDKIYNSISFRQVLQDFGVDINKTPTNCPMNHPSKGGKCFSWNDEVGHCFHCKGGWNKFDLVKDKLGLTDKETFDWFAEKAGMKKELKQNRKEFVQKEKVESHINEQPTGEIFSTIGQARTFIKQQPLFYDKHGIFWEWNFERFCYEMSDEVSILNKIRNSMRVDTIDSKKRSEIIAALKQIGREYIPIEKPKHWIQFIDQLVDVKTKVMYQAAPKYFLTNPIPHKLGATIDTPIIDKLFFEWTYKEGVQDKSFVQTLKEVIAYGLIDDLFMQRWFAFTGSGSNGKGTCENFIIKMVGKENCASFELKKLSSNNFAVSALYKKPIAFAGEVSYEDLSNTNALKKLTGEDHIEFEFKGRDSFSGDSITTVYILTNSLPITPDKSVAFYRRCLIIDFPNQFEIVPSLLDKIPEKEYENFCLQCVEILHGLYQTHKFTNEGTIEERMQKYESKSNPLPNFIEEFCNEDIGLLIPLKEFTSEFNIWLRSQRLRVLNSRQVGTMLRNEGYQIGKRKDDRGASTVCILNLGFITTRTTRTTKDSGQVTIGDQCQPSVVSVVSVVNGVKT